MGASYSGPGPLTVSSGLHAWTLDVVALVCVVVAAVAYARGVTTVQRHGGRWPALRTASFGAGLLVVALATCSAVGVYAPVLFWMYVVQACVLLLLAPMLLGAGAPLALAAAAPGRGERVERWTAVPLARVARLPGFGPAMLIVATSVLFFTPLMPLSLEHPAVGQLVRLGLVAVGLVMALPVTDERLSLTSVAYAAALGLALLEFLVDAVPGIALRLQSGVLHAGYWAGLGRPWGPSPIEDQRLAGAVLWFFGEAGDIPFIAALLVSWVASDAREARAVDRALDEQAARAARPAHPAAGSLGGGGEGIGEGVGEGIGEGAELETYAPGVVDPDRQRPWWETDPSVFGETRARRNGWGRGPRAGSGPPD